MMERPIRIPKGSIVTCPQCGVEIAEVMEDLRQHDQLRASSFRGISQEIKQHDETRCKKCGMIYFHDGMIHTREGWR